MRHLQLSRVRLENVVYPAGEHGRLQSPEPGDGHLFRPLHQAFTLRGDLPLAHTLASRCFDAVGDGFFVDDQVNVVDTFHGSLLCGSDSGRSIRPRYTSIAIRHREAPFFPHCFRGNHDHLTPYASKQDAEFLGIPVLSPELPELPELPASNHILIAACRWIFPSLSTLASHSAIC